jgi:hypothetical protein
VKSYYISFVLRFKIFYFTFDYHALITYISGTQCDILTHSLSHPSQLLITTLLHARKYHKYLMEGVWEHMLIIPALWRNMQEDDKFKVTWVT